jgi:hypothetical protein
MRGCRDALQRQYEWLLLMRDMLTITVGAGKHCSTILQDAWCLRSCLHASHAPEVVCLLPVGC